MKPFWIQKLISVPVLEMDLLKMDMEDNSFDLVMDKGRYFLI
jgi:hypothetical protein